MKKAPPGGDRAHLDDNDLAQVAKPVVTIDNPLRPQKQPNASTEGLKPIGYALRHVLARIRFEVDVGDTVINGTFDQVLDQLGQDVIDDWQEAAE